MFRKHRHRARTGQVDAVSQDEAVDEVETGGFNGLEGDFESERRRAAAATHDHSRPYEHGEEENGPVLPGTTSGWTHP